MLNRETGEVTCDYCGESLGNYLTGDFYKLIRLKYCPTCKQKKNRQDWRAAQKDCRNRRRKKLKEQEITIEELMKIVVLLKEQNKLLQEQVEKLKQEGA